MRRQLSESEIAGLPEDTVAQRIKKLRMSANKSQEQFSEKLGFSVNYYGQVERGAKALSKKMADALCEHFGTSYRYLYQGIRSEQIGETSAYDTSKKHIINVLNTCTIAECELIYPLLQVLIQERRQREMALYASRMETKKRPGRPKNSQSGAEKH